jgi:hypothetical protein
MKAETQRMRAKVVEAEAQIPQAIAEAFRSGNLGVMDYYRLNNIKADTEMRGDRIGAGAAAEPVRRPPLPPRQRLRAGSSTPAAARRQLRWRDPNSLPRSAGAATLLSAIVLSEALGKPLALRAPRPSRRARREPFAARLRSRGVQMRRSRRWLRPTRSAFSNSRACAIR